MRVPNVNARERNRGGTENDAALQTNAVGQPRGEQSAAELAAAKDERRPPDAGRVKAVRVLREGGNEGTYMIRAHIEATVEGSIKAYTCINRLEWE